MKQIFLIGFLLLSPVVYAQSFTTTLSCHDPSEGMTVLNANGDISCAQGNTSYTLDSQATQDAKAAAQATIDSQRQADQQLQQLIEQDKTNLAIQDLQSQGLITSDQATAQTAQLTTLNTAVSAAQAAKPVTTTTTTTNATN